MKYFILLILFFYSCENTSETRKRFKIPRVINTGVDENTIIEPFQTDRVDEAFPVFLGKYKF